MRLESDPGRPHLRWLARSAFRPIPTTMTGRPLKRELSSDDALLIVDLQNDFLPGGSLAVPEGDAVIAPLNRCIAVFTSAELPVIATRDWHPPEHCSFLSRGGPWPAHCVQQTSGAGFAPGLALPANAWVVDKATDPERDDYSEFSVAGFDAALRTRGIHRLFMGGLATEYCVRETVLDALRRGLRVVVLLDCIRPIERRPGDGERAIASMKQAGADFCRVGDLAPC